MWFYKHFWILCLLPVALTSQDLHFPGEIKKIMLDSEVSFENHPFEKPYGFSTYSLLFSNPVSESSSKIVLNGYTTNLALLEDDLWKSAELYFEDGQIKKAKKTLLKLLERNPDHVPAMIKMGEIELEELNLAVAQDWLEKSLKKDNRSSQALFRLGELYCEQGYLKLGSELLLKAHILNRNQHQIFEKLAEVIEKRGFELSQFDFNPKYSLERGEDGSIRINASEKPWIAYGNCKALWKYDLNYNSRFPNFSAQDFCLVEEKESLLNALIEFEGLNATNKNNSYPSIVAFRKSISSHHVNEYILYEISLTADPEIAGGLSEDSIESLMRYFNSVRLSQPELLLSGDSE